MDKYYTLGYWLVREGAEEEFVREWQALGAFFLSLPDPPGTGTLIRSLDDPHLFYSFGPWPSLEAVQKMRAHPDGPAWIARLTALCDEARPGGYRLVATV